MDLQQFKDGMKSAYSIAARGVVIATPGVVTGTAVMVALSPSIGSISLMSLPLWGTLIAMMLTFGIAVACIEKYLTDQVLGQLYAMTPSEAV